MTKRNAELLAFCVLCCGLTLGGRKKPEPGHSGPSASAGELTPMARAAQPSADPCSKLCAVAQALRCPAAASCSKTCAEMRSDPACQLQVHRALECMAREPPEHFECDAEGQAAIRDGYCDAEQSAVIECASGAAK